jgi:branched-chain amino acid transport system ATP-binding protein
MGLDVNQVTVRFGGLLALDGATIDAGDGLVTGLIGPNGAGKTTLFNVITGVQQAQSGTVLLGGRPLDRLRPHKRARLGLGRTFQRLELFGSLTVGENVRVAVTLRHRQDASGPSVTEATQALLRRLGLEELADTRADSLSTGSGRLVELARCLALEPSVLLLDEPASGQDEAEMTRFAAILGELAAGGMAVLLVEHDIDLVMRVCQRVHVLDFGRVLASGTPVEVRNHPDVQAAYLGEVVGT